jgi:hypothetical protein
MPPSERVLDGLKYPDFGFQSHFQSQYWASYVMVRVGFWHILVEG